MPCDFLPGGADVDDGAVSGLVEAALRVALELRDLCIDPFQTRIDVSPKFAALGVGVVAKLPSLLADLVDSLANVCRTFPSSIPDLIGCRLRSVRRVLTISRTASEF